MKKKKNQKKSQKKTQPNARSAKKPIENADVDMCAIIGECGGCDGDCKNCGGGK